MEAEEKAIQHIRPTPYSINQLVARPLVAVTVTLWWGASWTVAAAQQHVEPMPRAEFPYIPLRRAVLSVAPSSPTLPQPTRQAADRAPAIPTTTGPAIRLATDDSTISRTRYVRVTATILPERTLVLDDHDAIQEIWNNTGGSVFRNTLLVRRGGVRGPLPGYAPNTHHQYAALLSAVDWTATGRVYAVAAPRGPESLSRVSRSGADSPTR